MRYYERSALRPNEYVAYGQHGVFYICFHRNGKRLMYRPGFPYNGVWTVTSEHRINKLAKQLSEKGTYTP